MQQNDANKGWEKGRLLKHIIEKWFHRFTVKIYTAKSNTLTVKP